MAQDEKTPGATPASANETKAAPSAKPVKTTPTTAEPEPYDGRGGVYKMIDGKRVRVEDPQ